MRRAGPAWIVALLCARVAAAQAVAELAQGIREVKDGEFEAAVLTLDAAVQKLATTGRPADLAEAHVYLGVAYLGLGQETLAKLKFRQALTYQPGLHLSPDEFSSRTIRVFEATRAAAQHAATLEKEAKKSKGKGGLVLLGVGGAAAAGVGLAIIRQRNKDTPPTGATITVSPEGQAIVDVTRVTFTGSASDADRDALSYTWDFGDGQAGSSATVTHVYAAIGEQHVGLKVSDGVFTTSATTTVTVGILAGTWHPTSDVLLGVTEYQIIRIPGSPGFGLTALFPGGVPSLGGGGQMEHPRTVRMNYNTPADRPAGECHFAFDGAAEPLLKTLSGMLTCSVGIGPGLRCECAGQQQPLTLVR